VPAQVIVPDAKKYAVLMLPPSEAGPVFLGRSALGISRYFKCEPQKAFEWRTWNLRSGAEG
jgi:hypothetical protein